METAKVEMDGWQEKKQLFRWGGVCFRQGGEQISAPTTTALLVKDFAPTCGRVSGNPHNLDYLIDTTGATMMSGKGSKLGNAGIGRPFKAATMSAMTRIRNKMGKV